MLEIEIHGHALKHGISDASIKWALTHCVALRHRDPPHEGQIVAIGPDEQGRLLQVVGIEKPEGMVIYHALRPPTRKVLYELGIYL